MVASLVELAGMFVIVVQKLASSPLTSDRHCSVLALIFYVHLIEDNPQTYRCLGGAGTFDGLRHLPVLDRLLDDQMVFEIIVLVATLLNALSVPRQANMPLRNALHRDGITFFMVCLFPRHHEILPAYHMYGRPCHFSEP